MRPPRATGPVKDTGAGSEGDKIILSPYSCLPGDPKAALKELKRLVGAGGALRDSAVELQGDHAEKLIEHLTRQGHRVRRVGG